MLKGKIKRIGRTVQINRTVRITEKSLEAFEAYLTEEEKSPATIKKYMSILQKLMLYLKDTLKDETLKQENIIKWKLYLIETGLKPQTVNTKIYGWNSYASFIGREDMKLKSLRIQRRMFRNTSRDLSRNEYEKLIEHAKASGKQKAALIIETIGATGMRVSEVKYLTVEAVDAGKIEISLKGKIRTIIMPDKLKRKLRAYAKKEKISSGVIFRNKKGYALCRQKIWQIMKNIAAEAGVEAEKVFPHNLRHLFARIYYKATRNLTELAGLLGHSSIDTTRIYLLTTEDNHIRQLEKMKLVC